MVVFGRSVPVEIVHAPGTPQEKRRRALMGGDLKSKALFYAADRVVTGDEIHAELFDEARIVRSVNPVTALDGTLTHWEAQIEPRSHWQHGISATIPQREPLSQPIETVTVLIFISHSSEDQELARRLTELLRAAFLLPVRSIRCTSVEGHRLPGGADTNQQLKREIREAPVFVGIVSTRSNRSMYVLFELGARWGADKHFLPLLAPGASSSDLVGPMAGINALRADTRAQLHQLLEEVAAELKLELQPAYAYEHRLEQVLGSPAVPTPITTSTPAPAQTSGVDVIKGLSDDAAELLIEASADPQGTVFVVDAHQGFIVQANGKQFVRTESPRSEARWRSALEELSNRGLLQRDDSSWVVTDAGNKAADLLEKD